MKLRPLYISKLEVYTGAGCQRQCTNNKKGEPSFALFISSNHGTQSERKVLQCGNTAGLGTIAPILQQLHQLGAR